MSDAFQFIFHLDFDSFFASVEQQANPRLRGKAIGVLGKPGGRTIVAAASREAKKFGVKTAMMASEAKRICPAITFVVGDPQKYQSIHKKFIKILTSYSPQVEVFSIDEAFMRITAEDPYIVARLIKEEIKKEIGEFVTISIGVASSKLLAKIGSELEKPNGLVWIKDWEIGQVLTRLRLTDFCGIGSRIYKRLKKWGINTPLDLARAPKEILDYEFKGKLSDDLSKMVQGQGLGEVGSVFEPVDEKSFGHSTTLPYDTFDLNYIKSVIVRLSQDASFRMRQANFVCKTVSLWVRTSDFAGFGGQKTFSRYTISSQEIASLTWEIFLGLKFDKKVRALGISLSNLNKNYVYAPTLFETDFSIKNVFALKGADEVNERFGQGTIYPASNLLNHISKNVAGFYSKDKLRLDSNLG